MTDHDPETGELPENQVPATVPQADQVDDIPVPQPQPQNALPITAFDKLADSIAGVMEAIEPVVKRGKNEFQNYKFPRMQDVLQVLTPAMAKHGIVVWQSEIERGFMDKGNAVYATYDFTVIHKSGQVWPFRTRQTGVSRTRDSKGGFDDKSLNKCHTQARKVFLMGLFQIPTEDPDADGGRKSPPRTPIAGQTAAHPPVQPKQRAPVELKPHEGEGYLAWGERLMEQVLASTTVEQIDAWQKANARILDMMKRDKADIHKNITHSIRTQRGALALKDEPETNAV